MYHHLVNFLLTRYLALELLDTKKRLGLIFVLARRKWDVVGMVI
jgi:hypothetical protein